MLWRLPTGDPLDLDKNQALDQGWQIVVKPRSQHRLQHFTHQVIERSHVFNQNSLRERIPGGMHSVVDRSRHTPPTLLFY